MSYCSTQGAIDIQARAARTLVCGKHSARQFNRKNNMSKFVIVLRVGSIVASLMAAFFLVAAGVAAVSGACP